MKYRTETVVEPEIEITVFIEYYCCCVSVGVANEAHLNHAFASNRTKL